jgi:Holliday junction resolvasome RuvABC endonuclease subunit
MDVVMGIDPGFASMGVAVIGRSNAGARIQLLHLGTVSTAKATKKARVNLRATNDDQRRYDEIYDAIEALRQRYRPTAVGVEAYHPYVEAATGWKTAVVYGGIIFWARASNIYCAPYIPQDLKRRFCGNQSGSKLAVASVVMQLIVGAPEAYLATNKTQREHVGDALGHAVLVLEEIDRVRKIVRGMP